MCRSLKVGDYSKLKAAPYIVIREDFLTHPLLSELYSNMNLVEVKRVLFLDYNGVLPSVKSLHNHSGTEVSMFCKSSNQNWNGLTCYQMFSSSPFNGDNI